MKYSLIGLLFLAAACSPQSAQEAPAATNEEIDSPVRVEADEDALEELAEEVIASVNPLENDLRGLELAIRMDDAFRIKPDGAIFHLGAKDPDGVGRVEEAFVLVETQDIESAAIANAMRENSYVRTYRLDEADYDRMKTAETELMALRDAAPGQNQLIFNAEAKTCVEPDAAAPDAYRYMILVRSSPQVDFVPLFGDAVIERGGVGVPDSLWEPCTE